MVAVEHAVEAGQMLLKVGDLREGFTATGRRCYRSPLSDCARLLVLENARKVRPEEPDFTAFTAPRDPFSSLSKLCDIWEGATSTGELFLSGSWGSAWLIVLPNPILRREPFDPSHLCYLAALPPRNDADSPGGNGEVTPRLGGEGGGNGSPVTDQDTPGRSAMSKSNPRNARPRSFRILFHIEGEPYAVKPIGADPASGVVKAYRFQRLRGANDHENPGEYVCALTEEGNSSCECKGFLRWGHCKHLRTLKAAGMFDLPARMESTPELATTGQGD